MTNLETLMQEKDNLEIKNKEIEHEIGELKKHIYWNKRRIILIEKQIKDVTPKTE